MIPYNGWDREYLENKEEYLDLFDQTMRQEKYDDIEWFEKKIAYYSGRKHAVGVASATDALYFSLIVHGIKPGDEVLVTDFSWVSSSSCISMVGATPVFCDIHLDSYHINIDSIKRMFSNKTKALIYVHLFGNMTGTDEIKDFCNKNDIAFIEDAAQALGSSLNGVKAGSIGDSSVYSFNTNKVVAGINGGGAYLTDNDNHANHVRKLKNHGKKKDFDLLGYNSKLYSLNTAIINKRFENMRVCQEKRQEIARTYNKCFKDIPVHTQEMTEGLDHNYHKYVIRFDDKETRDFVKKMLSASVHYEVPLSHNPMYRSIEYRKDSCENSKHASNTVLSLPIHPWLTDDETDIVIDTVRGFL